MQGFAVPKEAQEKVAKFSFHGQPAELKHGSVVIAAITSCTNTSNPSVMLGAGLVAKKACELGLQVSILSDILCISDSCSQFLLLLFFFLPAIDAKANVLCWHFCAECLINCSPGQTLGKDKSCPRLRSRY